MKIHLDCTAVLDAKGVSSGSVVDLPAGAAVTDVLNLLRVKQDHQKYVVPFVNGERSGWPTN